MCWKPAAPIFAAAVLAVLTGCVHEPELPPNPGDILPRGIYGETPDVPASGVRLPATLSVYVNRPERGLYYMFVNDRPLYGKDVNGAEDSNCDAFDLLMTNRPALEWAFKEEAGPKIDEVKVEGVIRGELSREMLERLGKESGSDLVLVVRRIFNVNAKGRVPPTVALGPEGIFLSPVERSLGAESVALETQAVLFDVAGGRLYPLTSDLRLADLTTTVTTEDRRRLFEDMAGKSLLEVAGQVEDKLSQVHTAHVPEGER